MIYDESKNVDKYLGINVNLDIALEFLKNTDLNTLPIGITKIKDDEVFVNIMEAEPKKRELLEFEAHKEYADIQLDLIGMEEFDVGYEIIKEIQPYKYDIYFVEIKEYIKCKLGVGKFIIAFPNEPHRPTILNGNNVKIKKAVIKVKM